MSNEQQDIHTSIRSRVRGRSTRPLSAEERKKKQEKFLKALSEVGIIKYACQVAEIDRKTYDNWKNNDAKFAALLPDAQTDANDTLEFAAFEQSVLGMEEPAISAGQVVYEYEPVLDANGEQTYDRGKPVMKRGSMVTIKKYSPQLLITLLKARMPEKYKDKQQIEHSGPGGTPIQTLTVDPRSLTSEQLARLKEFAQELKEGEA